MVVVDVVGSDSGSGGGDVFVLALVFVLYNRNLPSATVYVRTHNPSGEN